MIASVVPIGIWLVFKAVIVARLLIQARFLGSHIFPGRSLLLSTTVLNDINLHIAGNFNERNFENL